MAYLLQMPHPLAFGRNITRIEGVVANMQWRTLGDLEAQVLQGFLLGGIIGDQIDLLYRKMIEHGFAHLVAATICRQAEHQIGIKRIVALILQGISANFIR